MFKTILTTKDYLTVCLGAHQAIPLASLYLCDWIKSHYPTLNTQETLTVASALIRSTTTMLQRNPIQKAELDKAVSSLLADRY